MTPPRSPRSTSGVSKVVRVFEIPEPDAKIARRRIASETAMMTSFPGRTLLAALRLRRDRGVGADR